MLNPFVSNESIKTETTIANYHTESNNSQSLNHPSILNHHHHHQQQQQHGMRQNNQFLNSSVLCSNSLTNCYTSNNSMLRSHDGQLLLNNNSNTENNFYLSSNHNEYKFNPNILTQQNQQINHHGSLIQGFHDPRYNYSYGGSLNGDSSIEKNTISPNSGSEFYMNVDSATAAAVAIATVSNQNQLNYNSGAFLRYMKPTIKQDLICKWIDQDSHKICNKMFNRMEDIGNLIDTLIRYFHIKLIIFC